MSGTCVSASPEKATIPMRSELRLCTNCLIFARATSSRFCGWKSIASMELEMSKAITMLMPSLVDVSARAPERGRASAMMPAISARLRRMASVREMPRPACGPRFSTGTREKTMAGGRRRRASSHHTGSSSRSSSHSGCANWSGPSWIMRPPSAMRTLRRRQSAPPVHAHCSRSRAPRRRAPLRRWATRAPRRT